MIETKSNYTRKDIIKSIKMGDYKSLEEIYKNAFPSVRKYICKNNGSEDEAKDIFQDAMHVFINKVYNDQLEPDTNPNAFLFGVSRNLWLKDLRDKPKVEALVYGKEYFKEEYEIFKENHAQPLEQALAEHFEKIGEKCKGILQAFYYEKLSMKEIAEKFRYRTEAAAKNRKYACLQSLILVAKEKLSIYR